MGYSGQNLPHLVCRRNRSSARPWPVREWNKYPSLGRSSVAHRVCQAEQDKQNLRLFVLECSLSDSNARDGQFSTIATRRLRLPRNVASYAAPSLTDSSRRKWNFRARWGQKRGEPARSKDTGSTREAKRLTPVDCLRTDSELEVATAARHTSLHRQTFLWKR